MSISVKDISDELRQSGLWVVAFVGVCVLIGIGKIKAETIEYLLFAMLGAAATKKQLPPASDAEGGGK